MLKGFGKFMELTLDQALQKGIEAHKAGQVQEADRLYTAILKAQPKHPDANHNMGVLAVDVGKAEEALPFFKTALEVNPDTAQFWLSYIDALIKLERLEDAKAVFDQAKEKGAQGDGFDKLQQHLQGIEPTASIVSNTQDPPQEQFQPLIDLYNQGQFQEALNQANKLLRLFSNSVSLHNICGVTNRMLGRYNAAVDNYKQALRINPGNADICYNMGISLKQTGDLDLALDAFKQALNINPDYADAYNDIGVVLHEMGNLEEAVGNYKDAIRIKPDFADAYNNMGNALKDWGNLEEAIESYKQAIKIKPAFAEAYNNMIALLTTFTPQSELSHPIIKINQEICKIDIKEGPLGFISDCQVVDFFNKSLKIVSSQGFEFRTDLLQVYRRNSNDFNCKRHHSIFAKHDIIPEFCFGCYKVQLDPRSVVELLKLFVIFDQLQLIENNTRKCLIELRPKISGFYKGLIYCTSLEQANQTAEYLDEVVKQRIGPGLSPKVKRGCSEFPISFPDYTPSP